MAFATVMLDNLRQFFLTNRKQISLHHVVC